MGFSTLQRKYFLLHKTSILALRRKGYLEWGYKRADEKRRTRGLVIYPFAYTSIRQVYRMFNAHREALRLKEKR
jgi:hypothetical protein